MFHCSWSCVAVVVVVVVVIVVVVVVVTVVADDVVDADSVSSGGDGFVVLVLAQVLVSFILRV